MQRKTVMLSILGTVIAFVVIDRAVASITLAQGVSDTLNLANVSVVRISGAASEIDLKTSADAAATAQMSGARRGWSALWHSAWFSQACPPNGSMRQEGSTLFVNTGEKESLFGWNSNADCHMRLSATLKPGTEVEIIQQATDATLTGEFSTVVVKSAAGRVALSGHATSTTVSGAALDASLRFDRVMQNEDIRLSGAMLDARIAFMVPTAISYDVNSMASTVDSALANVPGAKPHITIESMMAKVTIR